MINFILKILFLVGTQKLSDQCDKNEGTYMQRGGMLPSRAPLYVVYLLYPITKNFRKYFKWSLKKKTPTYLATSIFRLGQGMAGSRGLTFRWNRIWQEFRFHELDLSKYVKFVSQNFEFESYSYFPTLCKLKKFTPVWIPDSVLSTKIISGEPWWWSTCTPSTLTIQVRIPLKTTIFL